MHAQRRNLDFEPAPTLDLVSKMCQSNATIHARLFTHAPKNVGELIHSSFRKPEQRLLASLLPLSR